MRRRWLRLAVLPALPLALFLPLNYIVRSRRPVTVNIGWIAEKEQEKVALRALSPLLRRYPRATDVKVVWRVKNKWKKVLLGSMNYNRFGVLGLTYPVPGKKHAYHRGLSVDEESVHEWARQGEIVNAFGASDIVPE